MHKVGERLVKIVTGSKSQTINICTEENIDGKYEEVYRIFWKKNFITNKKEFIDKFDSISQLISNLKENTNASFELPESRQLKVLNKPSYSVSEEWANKNLKLAIEAVNLLTNEFLSNPFRHRVEHSLHCSLYENLMKKKPFSEMLQFEKFAISKIQKEWPESAPREEKNGRRGSFDFAIIGELDQTPADVSEFEYMDGLIRPGIAIELGLNYGATHLKEDIRKLINSMDKADLPFGIIAHYYNGHRENQRGVEEVISNHLLSKWKDRIFITCAIKEGDTWIWKLANDSELKKR